MIYLLFNFSYIFLITYLHLFILYIYLPLLKNNILNINLSYNTLTINLIKLIQYTIKSYNILILNNIFNITFKH